MFVEMMANGMGVPVFVGKAHATTFRRAERGASGGFDCFGPLPNPLPWGEVISSVYRNDGKRYGVSCFRE